MATQKKKILIAVLDWGLGHASRSIPVVRYLHQQGHEIILASDGRALLLLQKEFPHLKTISLPSYKISYRTDNMILNMLWQLPRITYAVIAEHLKLRKLVKRYAVEMIISDNRFGCFHPRVPAYFLTHQLNLIITGRFTRFLANTANRFWIRRYDECWIPDFEQQPNISGTLSHPAPFNKVKYIGPLTRMEKLNVPKKYQLCVVLSGPEPQRSYLEEILIKQVRTLKTKVLIVRGITEQQERKIEGQIEIVSFLTSEDLNRAICAAEIVITRSGYSTLMDLSVLGSKALLIPTPGQTEQEYLAEHFHRQGIFMMQSQNAIHLPSALKEMHRFKGMQISTRELKLPL